MAEIALDAPHDLLRWFAVQGTKVHWVTRDAALARGFRGMALRKLKPEHDGRLAGFRTVHGRGSIVNCSGRRFLTVDIRDAIAAGYEWPWDLNVFSFDPDSFVAEADRIVSSTWALDGATLLWKEDVHDDLKAGDPVAGALLSGPRGRYVTTKGNAYMMLDVVHYLHEGHWPWAGLKPGQVVPLSLTPQSEALALPEYADFDARIAAFKARPKPPLDWD